MLLGPNPNSSFGSERSIPRSLYPKPQGLGTPKQCQRTPTATQKETCHWELQKGFRAGEISMSN